MAVTSEQEGVEKTTLTQRKTAFARKLRTPENLRNRVRSMRNYPRGSEGRAVHPSLFGRHFSIVSRKLESFD
jgi:hypothetical protein